MSTRVSIALILACPFAASFGQATTVPNEVQMPGSQPGEVSALEAPNKCDNCHGDYDLAVEPAHNWRGGMMAQATRDPLFWATVAIAEQDFIGAGDLCIRCHSPEGWFGGRSTPTDGSDLRNNDATGVMCDLCHQLVAPDGLEHAGVQSPPFEAHDGGDPPEGYHGSGMFVLSPVGAQKLGPYDDASSPHSSQQSAFHRSPDLCGTCHDVSNPVVGDLAHNNGAFEPLDPFTFSGVLGDPVDTKAAFNNPPFRYGITERTYSEHMASELPETRVFELAFLPPELHDGALQNAYDLAMASTANGDYVDAERTFTCQTCHMPPVTGKGCNKANAPVRVDLPLHDLTGGNYWMPDVLVHMDGQDELLLGGGLSSAEVDALANGKQRALATLQSAGALHVQGDAVQVVNLTGHKLISGYPEGRRMWLNVRWFDRDGQLLREDGAYGSLTVQLDGVPTQVDTILDLDDPRLRIYEVHMAMSQEWATQLLGLGYPADLALGYDRLTGTVERTLGQLAALAPGTHHETFHFALNNLVVSDNRIPPYGMDHEKARERNVRPVPETLYGAPVGDEDYDHFDVVPLDPPEGAVRGRIRLLYQPTSWEYVQFLHLANDGSVSFLGQEGAKLLSAWQATGMAAPEEIATATWRRRFVELPASERLPAGP